MSQSGGLLRNLKFIRSLVWCCFLWVFTALSQTQTTFRQLSVDEGLSQNSVISIAQDSIGYLWFATQDGLNKYDGRVFSVYNFQFVDITNYEYSHLGKVYVDQGGKVWIIPISKVPYFYNRETDRFLALPSIGDVSAMYQDTQHNYWFGTYKSGLYVMRKDGTMVENVIPPTRIKTIYAFTEDLEGHVWISAAEGIFKYNAQTQQFVPYSPNTEEPTIFSAIAVDAENKVWVGTFGNGLWGKGNDSNIFEKEAIPGTEGKPLPNNLYILSLWKDSNQNLWIGSYGEGLYRLDLEAGTLQNFAVEKHNPRNIHYNDILSIYEDYTGTVWFGTDGAGASYHDKFLDKFNYFTNYLTPENVNIDVVRSITTDLDENIWIGTSGKGLTAYNRNTKQWKSYFSQKDDSGLSDERIMSLFADETGDIWIGTQDGGLNILSKDGKIKKYLNDTQAPFPGLTIWRIHRDPKKRFWIGTRNLGFSLFDKEKGVLSSFSATLGNFPSDNIRAIIDGGEDFLWIGTNDQGVFSFNTNTHEHKELELPEEELIRLKQFQIKALHYDQNRVVWIGTGGDGLKGYDTTTKKLYTYTVENGLANNVIYAVMPDNADNLWLSSNKGIIKFKPKKDFSKTPEINNYTNYDGLSNEFNTGAYFKDTNGDIYFGALDGIYWFDPSQMQESNIIPKTVITSFEVFNKPHPLKNGIRLQANQNTLTFNFSSMQFSLPSKNKYQYMLEGNETEWNQADNVNFARYTNLAHGSYTFRVKSSNYDGKWNDIPDEFSFTINKPWYLSPPALFAYFMLVILMASITYYYFKSRWQMQMELTMEYDRSDRLKQMNAYKTKLYTNLSHEFRTPLTLILAPVKKLLKNKNVPTEVKKDLVLVERSADRLVGLADQLLELSKVESGVVKLRVSHGNLELFLNAILASFIPIAIEKKIKLTSGIDGIGFAWFDSDVMEKIVNNLLTNAIKYTPIKGAVNFTALNDGALLQIQVENDVREIKEAQLDQIFERFYQSDKHNEGFGIGLSLVKELVSLNGGEIEASYTNGKRIRFSLKMPIEKSLFSDAEIDLLSVTPVDSHALIDFKKQGTLSGQAKKIILLVEDNQELRKFTKTLFENDFKVIEAENGVLGIRRAFEYIPDIIISDIMMPEKDGIALCEALKEDERTSHIPIILLTAKTGEENELIGLKTGADDYILKPYSPEKIMIRVQKLLESRIKLRQRYQQNIILRPNEIAFTSADEKFFGRLQIVLKENLNDAGFNAASFSKAIGMSRMQLHRKLTALTGLSTTAFITSQRLKSAMPLLKKNNITVAEVAYSTGFNSPSYFIKCFRETYGKTPSKYLEGNNG